MQLVVSKLFAHSIAFDCLIAFIFLTIDISHAVSNFEQLQNLHPWSILFPLDC